MPGGAGDDAAWGEGITDDLVPAWRDLLERDPDSTLFQTPEWLLTWWRHLGQGRLRCLTVGSAGRLHALAFLAERRERVAGVGARLLAFAGEPEADRLGVVCDPAEPAALAAAASALVEAVRAVDFVRLSEVPVGSRTDEALERACARPGATSVRRLCARAPVLALARPWPAIEAAYPGSLRTRLRRARRRQQEAGGLSFRRWQPSVAEVAPLLEEFREIERRTWKGEKGVGIFSAPARLRFYRDLSERLAERGWLDVATLSAGPRLVAYRYGFRYRGVFLDYNLAHDPADSALSPGRVLLDDVVRDCHRLGLRAVDASRGRLTEGHLLGDWTKDAVWHRRWLVFGRSARGRALALLERRLKPAWRRLRGQDEPGEDRS